MNVKIFRLICTRLEEAAVMLSCNSDICALMGKNLHWRNWKTTKIDLCVHLRTCNFKIQPV